MRFRKLDLNLLVALEALITESSISMAAQRLCLTQSAVSSALSRLRDFFDDELLINTGRKSLLTLRAEQLAEPVRAILLEIETRIVTPPAFDPLTCDRTFSIAASDYAIAFFLADAVRKIAQSAPGINFVFQPLDGHFREGVDRRETDLLVTLVMAMSPAHPSEPLFEDDFVVIAWDQHPALSSGLDLDLYQSLGHVAVQFGKFCLPFVEDVMLEGKHIRRRVEVQVPTFTNVPQLVVGTNRIATVHRRLAESLRGVAPLLILPVPFPISPVRQSIQWHRSSKSDAALQWIVRQMHAHARETSPPNDVSTIAAPAD